MRYVSTRGQAAPLSFADALLSGLAADGGLTMPQSWPAVGLSDIAGKSYSEAAAAILSRFAGDCFTAGELRADIETAYATFDEPAVAPLSELGGNRYLLELFHGPTLAFKDIAMQVLARMFARTLAKRGGRATILAATSGDTGSSAIAAFGGLPNVELFVLHPRGRISEVQRRQMTTADFGNVHNIALEGTFDDAQSIVKALFADKAFARDAALTAVNSINFARIAAQTVYYFTAAAALDAAPVFVVPTGNFGDAFAGEAAMRMGLGARKLVLATNQNDILVRALREGAYAPGSAHRTLSPSMDIQTASNFERALFEASARDARWTADAMTAFAATQRLELPQEILDGLRARYDADAIGDAETADTIARVHERYGRLIDPHTAVAMAAAEKIAADDAPVVVLSTAHAAKFPEAVRKATGISPPLPTRLRDILEKPERYDTLPADAARVRAHIEARTARQSP